VYWPNRPFISFDTETTGLSFTEDRIIQIGLGVFKDGKCIWGWEWLVEPEDHRPSHPDAVKTHGITDEYRLQKGTAPSLAIPRVVHMLNKMKDRGLFVVAFNAPFDFTMLRAECDRLDNPFPYGGLHVIDPLVVERGNERNIPVFVKPWMRQIEMAKRYGLVEPQHEAMGDAICAGQIAIEQSLHYPIRSLSMPELHRRQEKWYDEWAGKFISFARKKNFNVSIPKWPFGDT
jgi:DNA polymerase-3 subunit epsilon